MGQLLSILFPTSAGNDEETPKGKNKITDAERATLDLKTQKDKLTQYTKRIAKSIEIEKERIRSLMAEGRRDHAKAVLSFVKSQEKLIEDALGKQMSIERMISTIEEAGMNAKIFAALKEGTNELKLIEKVMSQEKVDKVMDDMDEACAAADEISKTLSDQNRIGGSSEDIDDELAALVKQVAEEEKPKEEKVIKAEEIKVEEKKKKEEEKPKKEEEKVEENEKEDEEEEKQPIAA